MALTKKTVKWINKLNISLKDKTVLVTGSNSGVGFKTVETALYLGARVIMACRNMEKAEAAREELIKDYPNASIQILQLDLSDFSSIDSFTKNIIDHKIDIDIFVNNAGTFHRPGKTKDGFENVLGTNYFAVYYLSGKILPYLKTLSHKVVYCNTISVVHKMAKIDYDDFYYTKKYNHFAVYARSKLCLAKYTYDLSQKYKESNISVYMIHPGISVTPLGANAFGDFIKQIAGMVKWVFNSPEKSALSLFYVLAKNLPSGSIAGPHILEAWGYPKENRVRKCVKTGADELKVFTDNEIKDIIYKVG
ncbi:MAG: SDR family NAD(P)-dependent oxidoreductase [Lachnospiraceae bacterium]|nr:SDR family NAD(P)-dependent oxidoreductase [Lachnospiraceae bacterium]